MHSLLKTFLVLQIFFATVNFISAQPYTVEVEEMTLPGTPAIHSFAFAQSGGKWLFIGGRTNGLHGFVPATAFPKQYSNKNMFVVDPLTMQTWSRNVLQDLNFSMADPLRSTNMQYIQYGNKLYLTGGYGYDSSVNSLKTFPVLTVIDVSETIQAIIGGTSISPYIRQTTNSSMQVTGGELIKLGDYFFLVGGHNFNGGYRRGINNQIYTNQIRKFKVSDDGVSISINDYSAVTDTLEYHRRDMNVVPCMQPDGVTEYAALYGGVFRNNIELPFLNPLYIYENSIIPDHGFEQKLSQYTCAYLSAFNSVSGNMHTTFFGGMGLYYFNEVSQTLEIDSLVPFTDDITTLTKYSGGSSAEQISEARLPALLGANAKFILNLSVPHYDNGVIKLNQLHGRTFAGYIFGGIEALLLNNGASFPSQRILKVYITPESPLPAELTSFYSSVNSGNVILNWITASEHNNKGFFVERKFSDNLIAEWINLGFVNGNGNSTAENDYTFEDKKINPGIYNYRLKQIDFNGDIKYHELSEDVTVGAPAEFYLTQNYPNPFNPSTTINIQSAEGSLKYNNVSLKVYDVLGNEIAVLINGKLPAGYYEVEFNGADFPSGMYLYKLEANGKLIDTKRMMLLK